MPHILIGGTNDGKRMEIPSEHDRLRLPCVRNDIPSFATSFDPLEALSCVQCETYTRQQLRGETQTFEVFAIDGMTGDQMIEQLIQHYKP